MKAWMEVFAWVRFLIGGGLLLVGVGTFIIEIIGVFRFKYVLNRMHAAAMGDTLGLGFALSGLIIISGLNFTSLKLFLVIAFLWFSSPASSHLIARLEVATDEEREKHYRIVELDAPAGGGEAESKAVQRREAAECSCTISGGRSGGKSDGKELPVDSKEIEDAESAEGSTWTG